MFRSGCVRLSRNGGSRWTQHSLSRRLPALATALSLFATGANAPAQSAAGPAFGQPALAPVAAIAPAAVQPTTFTPPGQVLSPLPVSSAAALQPVDYSRERRPPLDSRIVAMPDQFQKLEVIHHRSQLVIARDAVSRFAITDPNVIEVVQYSQTEFAVIGNGLGTTDLMIWFQGQTEPLMYLVTVIPDPSIEERRRIDFGKIERKLSLLYPNSKVYLIPMSRKIIVRGQARDPEEAARIMQVVRGEMITQDGALFAGYVNAQGDAATNWTANNTNDYLSSFIVNELQVPGEYQVQVRVRIAELNRAMLREYGINWDSIIQLSGDSVAFGSNLGGNDTLSFSGVFEDFEINTLIRALASNGTIKVMEDATLVTMSGQAAAFLSGGEFAVPSTVGLQGAAVGTTTFRGFGTSVIATPTIVDNDLIRLQIVPELSSINNQTSVGGVFGVNVKRVQTQVELREGQTMVLGGLFSRQEAVEQTRIPLLGELPIIGPTLFHARRATQDEIELLIVVTPEIVRPVDADQQPPMPGWYVTHPDDIDFCKLNRTEGNPDLGHYQLLPYGNGQGYAHNVGYNYYNPAPAGGSIGPAATGGQYGAPAPGYGGYQQAPPAGYMPAPAPQGNPLMPQPQYAPLPSSGPEPTPADLSRFQPPYRGPVQPTGAQYPGPQSQGFRR
jgi:pilus assembly protein CpaC